jgi:LPXTG-motif cell wall-anchored protein
MRGKISAGVVLALAFLIPAAPAVAQAGPTGLNEACQTAERKVYKDFRELLLTIDLETATDDEVEDLATQILDEAKAESLPVLPRELEERQGETTEDLRDLRAFLKADVLKAWSVDLRISVGRTMTGAGTNVRAAAQKALDAGVIDAYLAYLNDGLYVAREVDCESQPTPTPSVTPTVTPSVTPSTPATATPIPTPSTSPGTPGGEGGGLPVTGANIGTVAGIGGALLLLGGVGFLVGRRRRSRFVA